MGQINWSRDISNMRFKPVAHHLSIEKNLVAAKVKNQSVTRREAVLGFGADLHHVACTTAYSQRPFAGEVLHILLTSNQNSGEMDTCNL